MKIQKIIFAILATVFGFPVLAKIIFYFGLFQLFLGSLFFDTSEWKTEDKLAYIVGSCLITAFIITSWCAHYWPDEKKE